MLKRFFASGAGLGYIPFAPGTWGSLGTVLLLWFLPPVPLLISVGFIVLISVAGAAAAYSIEKEDGLEDPGWIVIDEVAGQWIAVLFAVRTLPAFAAAFILFRLFDISKPWIIDRSQRLGMGWGVMMDDILAGLLAGILVLVFQYAGWLTWV